VVGIGKPGNIPSVTDDLGGDHRGNTGISGRGLPDWETRVVS
jgi:hypothetical protein